MNRKRSKVIPGTLDGLDAWMGDAIGLFIFSDVKPLAGVAGFVDWRACGALSRTLEGHNFEGARGESMLLSAKMRSSYRRLFVFGLGSTSDVDAGIMRNECRKAVQAMKDAGVVEISLAAPASRSKKDLEKEFVRAAATAIFSELSAVFVEEVNDELAGLFV
ncbi:MAG: peptidase M17 [Clostridia bacterium]|nr:peptidase M17 [Deltaproteobacteria bacterium]